MEFLVFVACVGVVCIELMHVDGSMETLLLLFSVFSDSLTGCYNAGDSSVIPGRSINCSNPSASLPAAAIGLMLKLRLMFSCPPRGSRDVFCVDYST